MRENDPRVNAAATGGHFISAAWRITSPTFSSRRFTPRLSRTSRSTPRSSMPITTAARPVFLTGVALETRNQKAESRSRKQKAENQKAESRKQKAKAESRKQKAETRSRNQKAEARNQRWNQIGGWFWFWFRLLVSGFNIEGIS